MTLIKYKEDIKKIVEYKEKMIYRKYRWKWDNYPKLYKIEKVPINLDIELTTRCNLKCIMCEHSYRPPKPMSLPIDVVKQIIDEFVEKGGSSIKFVYLGEPLLYKGLAEVIEYAKQQGIIETIIATNGNLLTKNNINKLIKSGLDFIIFSVDSCNPEIYSKIRINGNLRKVRQAILTMKALKQLYGVKKPIVQIQTIPMKLNKEEIDSGEYHEYWKPFVDKIRISPYCENYNITKIIGETPNFFCPSVYRRMTIRADGEVTICCGERNDNKIIGNIYKQSIEDIWLSGEFTRIRKLMRNGKSHLIECCQTCSARNH